MKKVSIILAVTFLILFLSSCLKTLHPIFTEKDIVYEPKLLGYWKTDNQDSKGTALITNLSGESSILLPEKISSIKQKGYLIINRDEKGTITAKHIAFLARIGKHLYFDYYPADTKEDQKLDEFFGVHFVRMHTSYRVEISKNGNFELSQLDEGFITKLIDEKKIRISHETDGDDNIVITASTKELQQYLLKYGDEPSAYRSEKTIFEK